MTHKTKGIILRTVKYGETSIITTVYTEQFGLQNYIVKGVRQGTKKSQGTANYFQPAAILQMVVYKNELKNLQFIKEHQWAYLYDKIFFDVVRNASALYVMELLSHCIKQPENHPSLFQLIEHTLLEIDKGSENSVANTPLFFTLQLGGCLGFQIQGEFGKQTPILDLIEGRFVAEYPAHQFYITGEASQITSSINLAGINGNILHISLNRNMRRELLDAYRQYISFHVSDFGEMKTIGVLKEVLG